MTSSTKEDRAAPMTPDQRRELLRQARESSARAAARYLEVKDALRSA